MWDAAKTTPPCQAEQGGGQDAEDLPRGVPPALPGAARHQATGLRGDTTLD